MGMGHKNDQIGELNSFWLIIFEVQIPNLVCGQWSVMYHLRVTATSTSDLVSIIGIESGAYLRYSLRQEFQIWCVYASWDGGVSRTIFGLL